MVLMKVKQKKMNKIDRIIKESINEVIGENNFKTNFNRIKAASHSAAKKDGGKSGSERISDFLAKQAAIRDINRERADSRREKRFDTYVPSSIEGLRGDEFPEDPTILAKSRRVAANDYFNSENEFNRPINFDDAEEWIRRRRENDDFLDNEDF